MNTTWPQNWLGSCCRSTGPKEFIIWPVKGWKSIWETPRHLCPVLKHVLKCWHAATVRDRQCGVFDVPDVSLRAARENPCTKASSDLARARSRAKQSREPRGCNSRTARVFIQTGVFSSPHLCRLPESLLRLVCAFFKKEFLPDCSRASDKDSAWAAGTAAPPHVTFQRQD